MLRPFPASVAGLRRGIYDNLKTAVDWGGRVPNEGGDRVLQALLVAETAEREVKSLAYQMKGGRGRRV